ncbi:unnamed protein product [Symbiodinium sp. KB8]|nr:unnamed protein product [Symbiodinium sp. KB8]
MTFLWASPGSVGAPPPAKVQAAPTVDPGTKTTEAVEAAKTPAPEICGLSWGRRDTFSSMSYKYVNVGT